MNRHDLDVYALFVHILQALFRRETQFGCLHADAFVGAHHRPQSAPRFEAETMPGLPGVNGLPETLRHQMRMNVNALHGNTSLSMADGRLRSSVHGFLELSQGVDVLLWGFECAAAGPNREMCGPQFLPGLDLGEPVLRCPAGHRDAALDTYSGRVTSRLQGMVAHAGDGVSSLFTWGKHREPAISKPTDSTQRRCGGNGTCGPASPDPDGDRSLHRQWIQTSVVDLMPLAFEIDHLLRPQRSQDSDLLLASSATVMEVFAKRFIFDRVPAHTNPQPQSTAAEYIHLGGLLGD